MRIAVALALLATNAAAQERPAVGPERPFQLAPRIENLSEWRGHLLARLRRDIEVTADPALSALLDELLRLLPAPRGGRAAGMASLADIAVPLRLKTEAGTMSFLSTTTVFGTPVDVTVSELAIESFFPMDAATTALLRANG